MHAANSTNARIGIAGAGGLGRETALAVLRAEFARDLAFIDDAKSGQTIMVRGVSVPVMTFDDFQRSADQAGVLLAIGNGARRAHVAANCVQADIKVISFLDPSARVDDSSRFGIGVIISAGTTITTDCTLGDGVFLNLHVTVGHDSVIGDYTTVHPGAHISGNVQIEDCVTIGTGAVIINGTSNVPMRVGRGATIGAGAVVTKDVAPESTVVGVPARPLG